MNGCVYDPALARFTSADPTIQFADNPQSLTDPSGYGLFGFVKKIFKAVVKKIFRVVKKIFRVVKSFLKNPEMLVALAIGAINPAAWAGMVGAQSVSTATVFSQGFASGLVASKGSLDDAFIAGLTAGAFD